MISLVPPPRSRWLAVLFGAVCVAAGCGGKVVLDTSRGGAGGAATAAGAGGTVSTGTGGTTATTATTGATTSSGGVECSGTYAALASAVQAAQACNDEDDFVQCNGSATVHNACGCQVIANEALPVPISAANALWSECVSLGCCGPDANPLTPPVCNPCSPSPVGGSCDPMTNLCVPVLSSPPPP